MKKLVFFGDFDSKILDEFLLNFELVKDNVLLSNNITEIIENKPLLIISNKILDKNNFKCPIIILKTNTAKEMYEELKKHIIRLKYHIKIDFINKEIYFSNEIMMQFFIKHCNDLKIYNVSTDGEYLCVAIFIANKYNLKIEIVYHNYCYIPCKEEHCEKRTLTNISCKKFFYKYYSELPDVNYEKDIHPDHRFIIDYYDYFEPVKKDDINYMTFDIETNGSIDVINVPVEIISIVYYLNDKYEFLVLNNGKNNFQCYENKEDIKIFETEKELISYFAKIFSNCNLVTGFNTSGFDLIYLMNRAKKLGLYQSSFSPIMKVKNNMVYESDRNDERNIDVFGVDCIDTMKYVIDKYFVYALDKPSQFNLDYLGKFLGLGTKVHDVRGPSTLWLEDPQKLYDYNIQDVKLCRDIENYVGLLNYLLSFKNLMSTFNFKWSMHNSKIIDFFILCHYSKKYVFPNKQDNSEQTLKGGFVMEPIQGIYQNVGVFDYKSLYPNIIRQFNISYETVSNKKDSFNKYLEITTEDNETIYISQDKRGLIGEVIDDLMFMKDDIGNEMKTSKDKNLYVKYNAIKALINGIYGVFNYRFFRMYSANSAKMITYFGRTLVKKAIELSTDNIFIPIAGDTDSIFVWYKMSKVTNDFSPVAENLSIKDVFENRLAIVNVEITKFVKEQYGFENKYLLLEFETLFTHLLMTKAKKKYYGFGNYIKGKTYDVVKEYGRGIDLVKRDTPLVLRPILKDLLVKLIMVSDENELRKEIKKVKDELYQIPYKDLTITKHVSKELEEYKVVPQHVRAMGWSNAHLGTNFSRQNYKGGMIYVKIMSKYPAVDAIMINEDVELPKEILVNYDKYFEIFIKNKIILFLDRFQNLFSHDNTLSKYLNF